MKKINQINTWVGMLTMRTKILKQNKEFIFPIGEVTENCHASTILPYKDTLVAAWFGGTKEGNDDVKIWVSIKENGEWSKPYSIAVDGKELPHWNPVLYLKEDDTICLYFKYGKPISKWRTYSCVSRDGGKSFCKPEELVPKAKDGARGPVKNKQIRLSNGTVLAPSSKETKHFGWKCFTDISEDDGKTYKHSKFVPRAKKNGKKIKMIQPTLWEDKNGVHMLIRTDAGRIYKSDSTDFGYTWCKAYETPYPNPNSGIDLVKLKDETIVLCMNPTSLNWGNRSPIVLMRSFDGGNTFEEFIKLEDLRGDYEFSYPAITCVDNILYVTYTYERKSIVCWEIEIE